MDLDIVISRAGLLRDQLRLGVTSTVTAHMIKVNLSKAGEPSGRYIEGNRYGRGEVGEIVLVESQQNIIMGRVTEVRLPDRDRTELAQDFRGDKDLDAIAFVQLLGSIDISTIRIQAGLTSYPRLGDRVFSAPSELISHIPELMNTGVENRTRSEVTITLGKVTGGVDSQVSVAPEKLFGRHCAILGSTGGGKSWTTARLVEECAQFSRAKILLLDATSEYRTLPATNTEHRHLGDPVYKGGDSAELRIPHTEFNESDFIALFEPSGKVQGPKLKEAIKSLRLAKLCPDVFPGGYVPKINQSKSAYRGALRKDQNSTKVDDPNRPFDVDKLLKQIVEECCYDNDDRWGGPNNEIGFCSSLLTRIQAVTFSPSLKSVFRADSSLPSISNAIEGFLDGQKQVLRVCMSDISYEFFAREVLANVIGRRLLTMARAERFREMPLLVVLDEAHNFLGKRIGSEDHATKLDAFELIAKEGRKYGLNICLATQRPRDITEGVLSQMGTLIVHRLTNDRDREVVERACGEIDRSAASFLPNLKQGEVALIGVDFPIPMTIQIDMPTTPPKSDGPSFQKFWS
ncbi:ATP-binding protein [Saccharospirillum alexandrii]|uniref:ATP-binding protein n=1 Tax=Saccharospirillum alexandrii TaxID=2448477 RepID=UPI0037368BEB